MVLLDTYAVPSNPAPVPETVSDDDGSGFDLGWKPEGGHQTRRKGKQKSQGPDDFDPKLLEEESKVRCLPFWLPC